MTIATKSAAVMLMAALVLGGCAREIGSDTYEGPAVGEIARTYTGVVEAARLVEVKEHETLEEAKIGQLIGGVAGGFAGSAVGEGLGKAAAVAAGAIVGSLLGSAAEQDLRTQPAIEYIVRDEDGQLITLVQGTEPEIAVGTRVFVQEGRSGRSRIIHAN